MCNRIFVTGDTHWPIDSYKLDDFPPPGRVVSPDYLIVAGDFGGVWNGSPEEHQQLDHMDQRPYTTLFVDGNHENYDLLAQYPVEQWHGGKVQFIREHIIHLLRGQVFDLAGRSIFTMGGGYSIDKAYRTPHRGWWPQELPTEEEYGEAWANLSRCGGRVDYVISHAAPMEFIRLLGYRCNLRRCPEEQTLNLFLQAVDQSAQPQMHYFGHLHVDLSAGNQACLYNDIVELPGALPPEPAGQQPLTTQCLPAAETACPTLLSSAHSPFAQSNQPDLAPSAEPAAGHWLPESAWLPGDEAEAAKSEVAENGAAENEVAGNGAAGNGVAENGAAGNGVAENGAAENEVAENGVAENGAAENGVTGEKAVVEEKGRSWE